MFDEEKKSTEEMDEDFQVEDKDLNEEGPSKSPSSGQEGTVDSSSRSSEASTPPKEIEAETFSDILKKLVDFKKKNDLSGLMSYLNEQCDSDWHYLLERPVVVEAVGKLKTKKDVKAAIKSCQQELESFLDKARNNYFEALDDLRDEFTEKNILMPTPISNEIMQAKLEKIHALPDIFCYYLHTLHEDAVLDLFTKRPDLYALVVEGEKGFDEIWPEIQDAIDAFVLEYNAEKRDAAAGVDTIIRETTEILYQVKKTDNDQLIAAVTTLLSEKTRAFLEDGGYLERLGDVKSQDALAAYIEMIKPDWYRTVHEEFTGVQDQELDRVLEAFKKLFALKDSEDRFNEHFETLDAETKAFLEGDDGVEYMARIFQCETQDQCDKVLEEIKQELGVDGKGAGKALEAPKVNPPNKSSNVTLQALVDFLKKAFDVRQNEAELDGLVRKEDLALRGYFTTDKGLELLEQLSGCETKEAFDLWIAQLENQELMLDAQARKIKSGQAEALDVVLQALQRLHEVRGSEAKTKDVYKTIESSAEDFIMNNPHCHGVINAESDALFEKELSAFRRRYEGLSAQEIEQGLSSVIELSDSTLAQLKSRWSYVEVALSGGDASKIKKLSSEIESQGRGIRYVPKSEGQPAKLSYSRAGGLMPIDGVDITKGEGVQWVTQYHDMLAAKSLLEIVAKNDFDRELSITGGGRESMRSLWAVSSINDVNCTGFEPTEEDTSWFEQRKGFLKKDFALEKKAAPAKTKARGMTKGSGGASSVQSDEGDS